MDINIREEDNKRDLVLLINAFEGDEKGPHFTYSFKYKNGKLISGSMSSNKCLDDEDADMYMEQAKKLVRIKVEEYLNQRPSP